MSCADGDLRLVGGTNKDEGRVEICIDNQWALYALTLGSVADARVVCRQLNYSTLG